MKRNLKFLMVVVFLVVCCACTSAQARKETYKKNGISITYSADFNNLKGTFMPYAAGVDSSIGLGVVDFYYFAMPKAELDTILGKSSDEITEEDVQKIASAQSILAELISIDGGRDCKSILSMLGIPEANITELGAAEDVSFCAVVFPENMEAVLAGFSDEYRSEYEKLQNSLFDSLKTAEYFKPLTAEDALIGKTLSFVTKDSDGNTVNSKELFKGNTVTMINIWATWCPPCVGELASLSQMNDRLAAKGAAVVGICMDLETASDTFKSLISANNVGYLNLYPFETIFNDLGLTAYPTSVFVNSDGKIIAAPIVGAPADMATYESVIDSYLAGSVVSAESVEYESYVVKVSDEEGKPVAGATVQFCSDTSCVLGTTDESGCASFNAEPGVYTVHLLKVPEGYQNVSEEFTTGVSYGVTEITVRK